MPRAVSPAAPVSVPPASGGTERRYGVLAATACRDLDRRHVAGMGVGCAVAGAVEVEHSGHEATGSTDAVGGISAGEAEVARIPEHRSGEDLLALGRGRAERQVQRILGCVGATQRTRAVVVRVVRDAVHDPLGQLQLQRPQVEGDRVVEAVVACLLGRVVPLADRSQPGALVAHRRAVRHRERAGHRHQLMARDGIAAGLRGLPAVDVQRHRHLEGGARVGHARAEVPLAGLANRLSALQQLQKMRRYLG